MQDQLSDRKFPNWSMKCFNKNKFIEINMESMLTDYLVFSAKTNNIALNEKTVWRMIDKLSEMRSKL